MMKRWHRWRCRNGHHRPHLRDLIHKDGAWYEKWGCLHCPAHWEEPTQVIET